MNESCVRCGAPAVHRHHRKLRRHGDESEANLVPVCNACHTWIHANPKDAYATGYMLHEYEDPHEVSIDVSVPHDHTGECRVCGAVFEKKQSKPRFKGEARRQRRVIAIKVPEDWEDGGAVWDETLDQVKAELVVDGLYDDGEHIPNYEAVIAGLRDYIDTRPLVRSFREG